MDEWTSPLLDIENSHDSAPVMPKSVVVDMKRIFDPEKYPHLQKRPSFPIAKDIIYETHIKNFSHLNTMLPREKRGKLSGLGDSWTLNYFKRLGVNNIELMPIAPTCCGRQIQNGKGGPTVGVIILIAFLRSIPVTAIGKILPLPSVNCIRRE